MEFLGRFITIFSVLQFCDESLAIYKKQSLEDKDLCSPNFVHQFARRIFDHNQEVLINRHNALIISQTWKDNKSIKRFDEKCSFVVEATPKAGLIINVNQLYLRHNNLILRECYDYLRIYFSDGTKSEKICTPISANTTGIRSFIDPGGRVKVKIRLNDDIRLSPGGETLNLEMVFTQFEECENTGHFLCDTGKCISHKFVRDSVINCPSPHCLDENGCQNSTVITTLTSSYTSKRAIIGGIASSLVLIVGISICSCILCRYCKCRRNQRNQPRRSRRGNQNGERGRSRRPVDANAVEQQATESRPQQQQPLQSVIIPSAPPPNPDEEHKDAPPTYDSLFPGDQR